MEDKKTTITFYGGVGEVTGANFLLADGPSGLQILVDCGLFQGDKAFDEKNREGFPYDPKAIDYLFVTHAHLDHVGRIPKLIKEGFRGVIYSTAPTKEISEIAIRDSLNLFRKENRDGVEPFFSTGDIDTAMSLWKTAEYHETINLKEGLRVTLKDAGHILGSTMFEFARGEHRLVFTGDLGNSPSPLLHDTEVLTDTNYLVMESVYGDRNHEDRSQRRNILEDAIEDTMRAGGTLMIPAFSIERTQEILFEIENMMEESRIPLVPVFLDSPMGIEVTAVYKKYAKYLNDAVRVEIEQEGDKIFHFAQLHETLSTDESKAIFQANPKKIIIAGSGMSTGGRIIHHEKNYLDDPKSTLLLVGYQQVGSLGRLIQDGARTVKILGEEVAVRAKIVSIHGYSAHKDSDHLLQFVDSTKDTIKEVFVAMGEPKSAMFLAQRLRDYLGIKAKYPEVGAVEEIDL
ncbi:MAG: MBL fold metallo-hydrolase [Candidatus Paceibacterota bacterium]|jgi:metallo-beta-lactamase family protein